MAPPRGIHPLLTELDVLVDGSVNGVLKPDPRAYLIAADALGRPSTATARAALGLRNRTDAPAVSDLPGPG